MHVVVLGAMDNAAIKCSIQYSHVFPPSHLPIRSHQPICLPRSMVCTSPSPSPFMRFLNCPGSSSFFAPQSPRRARLASARTAPTHFASSSNFFIPSRPHFPNSAPPAVYTTPMPSFSIITGRGLFGSSSRGRYGIPTWGQSQPCTHDTPVLIFPQHLELDALALDGFRQPLQRLLAMRLFWVSKVCEFRRVHACDTDRQRLVFEVWSAEDSQTPTFRRRGDFSELEGVAPEQAGRVIQSKPVCGQSVQIHTAHLHRRRWCQFILQGVLTE